VSQTQKDRKSLEDVIITLGKTSCQKLCDRLYDKLPPELREQIYGYLVTFDHVLVLKPERVRLTPGNARPQYDPAYLGKNVAAEVAGYCYRKLRFEFGQHHSPDFVAWVQQKDPHGLIRSRLLRNIVLHLKCDDVGTEKWQQLIDALSKLRAGANITVKLFAHHAFWGVRRLRPPLRHHTREELWDTECMNISRLWITIGNV
jgi:hypothetical protein